MLILLNILGPHERLKNVMGWVPRSSTRVGGYPPPPFFYFKLSLGFWTPGKLFEINAEWPVPKFSCLNLMYSCILARNIFVKNV